MGAYIMEDNLRASGLNYVHGVENILLNILSCKILDPPRKNDTYFSSRSQVNTEYYLK